MSRLQTDESWADQADRLRMMTDPLQEKWDLSPNDVAAISAALARLDSEHHARLEAERRLAEALEVLREAKRRSGSCPMCGGYVDGRAEVCMDDCRLARVVRGET